MARVSSVVVAAVVVAGVAVVMVWSWLSSPAQVAPLARAAVVDVSDLPAFWEQQYSKASWYPLVSVPTWDGSVLTARTMLYPDGDAVEPAKSICVAMSMYWLGKGATAEEGFRPVRVLDQAGNILVSRRSFADQCTWRR